MPDKLPKGWVQTTLGEILPLRYGKARSEHHGEPREHTSVFGSSGVLGPFHRALTTGPTLIVGRKGNVGSVYYSEQPCWPIDTVYYSETTPDLNLPFFKYLLEPLRLKDLDRSTAIPGLSRGDYNTLQVGIPPFREQERIVAKLDAMLSRVARGEAAARRALERLKRYRAAVLHAAVTGELTRDWRKTHQPDETGAQLLKRLLQERRARWEAAELKRLQAVGKPPKDDKWKKRYKEPAKPEAKTQPDLPPNWTWISVGQISWSVKDGPHYSPKYVSSGIPFITGGNVRPTGVDFESAKCISLALHAELSKRCKPEVGDILYTKGGTTGIARVNTYKRDFSVWVHVAVLKLVDSVDPFFIQHSLNSPFCYAQAQRFTHGVGNQDLGLTRMVKITLALPPLEEQLAIIAEVDRKNSAAQRLEATFQKQIERASAMRQSLLREAFAGKLVPQDHKDEAASILLDRIRATRETETKKPKTKRMPKQKVTSVETLEQLEGLVHDLGKAATPECLFLAARLGDDVDAIEMFFDLLRAGRDKGSLVVPVGKGTVIRRVQNAN
jgi:type I restriction enzyme S subunit